jgi:hypothetical protein
MKHAKTYLVITACLLSIVAVTAMRLRKMFTNVKFGFYKPGFGCLLDGNKAWYTYGVQGSWIAITLVDVVVYTNSVCAGHTLFRSITEGNE